MPKHRLTLPPDEWPADLKERFERHSLTPAQRDRLRQALGRWFRISMYLGEDARDVSRATWLARSEGLPRAAQNDMRQALAIAFPDTATELYAGDQVLAERADERLKLIETITRVLARFPDEWRQAATPLLHVDPVGFGDGVLVQAWAPSTIRRRLEAAARHFDYCRANGLDVDISPASVRSWLRDEQARVADGSLRIASVSAALGALVGLAVAVKPDRSWGWLKTARDRMKKLASHHGSRNAARAVDAAELRAAGQQLLDKANAAHTSARNRRDFVKAHTKARSALLMILLSEAPIRISSCAGLELDAGLLPDLAGLYIDAANTKEGASDRRAFSATLVNALERYIRLHRAVIAAEDETRLFVGERGAPVSANQLSKCLGDVTETVFSVRVTPQAIRHSVANFIVASVPDEAVLASTILNHRSIATTSTYTQRADQVVASRKLRAAVEQSAAEVSADTAPTARKQPGRRRATRRPSRAQLARGSVGST